MARIAGIDLPREKRVEIGLTYIYGIGRPSATKILAQAGVNPDTRCRDLTDDEVKKISEVIDETMTVEGDLRREIALNIKWNAGWLRSRHGCSGLFDGSCLRGLRGKRRRRSWDGRRPGTVCGWNFKDLCQENKSLFVLFTLFVLNII